MGCPIAANCKGVSNEKRFTITYYKTEYDRMIARLQTRQGRRMKSKRQSTVEPVFGTLIRFMSLRKVNTIGIKQANKVMLMAGVAYNIKKYLKFIQNRTQSMSKEIKKAALYFLMLYGFVSSILRLQNHQSCLLT
ncbi:MAG: transposase [Bacteroidota bacterium]